MPKSAAEGRNQLWWKEFHAALRRDFARRKAANPRYSARKFGQMIGVSNGAISEILNGKRTLSQSACVKIAAKLKLPPAERRGLMAALNEPIPKQYVVPKKEDAALLRDWLTHAVLGLYELEGVDVTPAWIAKKLSVSAEDVQARVEMLLERKLLLKDPAGRIFRRTESWDTRGLWTKEEEIENQLRALDLAKRAVTSPNSLPLLRIRTIPGTPELLAYAKEEFERLSDRIDAMAEANGLRSELLRISFQLFRYDFESPPKDKS